MSLIKLNGKKKHVTINIQENQTPKRPYPKIKFNKMASITEQYQMKLIGDELIYSDDLMKAISKNDILACKELLAKSPGLPSWDKYFFHPLLLAAKKRRYEILEVLLDNGVEIDIQDKKGFNALHYAIQQRCVRCCNILIDRNINISLQDKFGNLPLHIAASEGIIEIVARLLELNQKPNARNKKDQTPLHFACMKGHDEILSLLLEKGGRWDLKDINFYLPLHCSAFHGHYRCCDILVQISGDRFKEHVNMKTKDKGTPLILAAKKGHSRCCQSLKEADINQCDNWGNTALHLAASVSFLKTVEVLIEMKPDVTIRNRDGNTAIHKAATQKDVSCLKLLIEYSKINPGLNNLNQTVVHMAAVYNSEECLSYLLSIPEFKKQVNARDNQGKTALHLALNQNFSEVSEILVNSGIDYTVKDEKGNIPLHVAAGGGMFNICKILLSGERVQRINDRNFMGTTPLHLVAMNGSADCCKLLLTKGADLNAIDSNGFSPFHIAANEGNLEVLKLFTRKGGGFINQVVEISGESCLHLAARKGFYNCCVFILNNMKKDFIIKLNDKENSALDEAYIAEHEQIFHLILSKIPMPNVSEKFNREQYYPFQYSLHSYMHEALANGRELIQRAIVESSWWFSGFSSSFCDCGQCPNLVNLTKENKTITEIVYQKCVEVNDSYTKYNFQIFEDFYYVPLKTPISDSYLKRESPFNPETGKLRKEILPFKKHNGHPLYVAAEMEHMDLMQHPLSVAYLNHKWVSYMRTILLGSVVSEVLLVLFLCFYLSFVENTTEISPFNVSDLCQNSSILSESLSESIDVTKEDWLKCAVTLGLLLFISVFIFITEMRWNIKIGLSFYSLISALRFYRILGIFVLLIPINFCLYDIVLKETWQWQIGICTLLLSWFHMIHTINEIPSLSVFMPVTGRFVKSFLRVLLYILLIVFIFAFVFHLLLQSKEAFATIPLAFIKTTVWILGDLAYDDMFLQKESPVMFPIMTNVIFLLLVTSISGFIVNMIIAQPTDHLDVFRERANYHKVASRIKLFLKMDSGFEFIKNRYLLSHIAVPNPKPQKENKYLKLKEPTENSDEQTLDANLLQIILERLDRIEAQIANLKK